MKTNGPGKYDWLATQVRTEAKADLVVVVVLGGSLGQGFSVQTINPELLRQLPELLETVAQDIRASTK